MARRWIVLIIVFVIVIAGALTAYIIYPRAPEKPATTLITGFILESPAFRDNGRIPEKYTCDGLDTSPPLRWRDQPPGTKSFAIIVEDPDAPGGIFTHWIVYNIPADVNQLDEGIEPAGELPGGIMQGLNDFGRIGYGGPCPPPGKPHRYVFRIYALDTMLELGPAASKNELLKLMKGHILAEATLTGIYSRLGG
jgi:Raf kinase inhibitor-like YbhB/YbcL family protein